MTSPFNRHHAVTLTFDLLQGQRCCRVGDHKKVHNSLKIACYYHDYNEVGLIYCHVPLAWKVQLLQLSLKFFSDVSEGKKCTMNI